MSVSLVKGGNVNLSKEAPGLTSITVGLGWDVRKTSGEDFDLDTSVFLLNDQDVVTSNSDFVFFNNLSSANGSVVHLGDNRTGEGEGDDEQIQIHVAQVAAQVQRIVFVVTIHEAKTRKQNFGMVRNAYARVINNADSKELSRFDLSEDASLATSMIFAEVYRYKGEWKFKAVGEGYQTDLTAFALEFGVQVG